MHTHNPGAALTLIKAAHKRGANIRQFQALAKAKELAKVKRALPGTQLLKQLNSRTK